MSEKEEKIGAAAEGQGARKTPECCGGASEMMNYCPCASAFARHRRGVYLSLAMIGLGFLILQVGWVLGVVAFFRTV